jgi:hypothetical protein
VLGNAPRGGIDDLGGVIGRDAELSGTCLEGMPN